MRKFDSITQKETISVKLNDASYPIIKAGSGNIPCLIIGTGTLTLRTLSKNFAEHFSIYSSDLYWVEGPQPTNLSMVSMVEDIKKLGEALNLEKYIILAHSAFGIVALEFAKKYPELSSGIVMIGTPLNSNMEVGKINNAIFLQQAEAERIEIYNKRSEEMAKEDFSNLTSTQKWLKEYIYKNAPKYWYKPDFDCSDLWKDVRLSDSMTKLFSEILPATEVRDGLESISTPVILAAGMSDYDCCPWVWKDVKNLPNDFTVVTLDKSGHWPQYEEPELFDKLVIEWCEELG